MGHCNWNMSQSLFQKGVSRAGEKEEQRITLPALHRVRCSSVPALAGLRAKKSKPYSHAWLRQPSRSLPRLPLAQHTPLVR